TSRSASPPSGRTGGWWYTSSTRAMNVGSTCGASTDPATGSCSPTARRSIRSGSARAGPIGVRKEHEMQRKDLVPVHGGLAEPVDRVVPLSERRRFLAEAERLPRLRVSKADLSTLHRIADGTLSPLEGPMKAEAFARVLDEQRILVGGKPYAWGIPLAFPATDEEAARLPRGGSAAVCEESGGIVAILDDLEVFAWDK